MAPKKTIFTGPGEGITEVTDQVDWANVEIPGTGSHGGTPLRRAGWNGTEPVASILIIQVVPEGQPDHCGHPSEKDLAEPGAEGQT